MTTKEDQIRAEFEAWVFEMMNCQACLDINPNTVPWSVRKNPQGDYFAQDTHYMSLGWKACAELYEQKLAEAKHREVELLAVIIAYDDALTEAMYSNSTEVAQDKSTKAVNASNNPSQALLEHEAKVLEEAAQYFEDEGVNYPTDELRRMAEERRKG